MTTKNRFEDMLKALTPVGAAKVTAEFQSKLVELYTADHPPEDTATTAARTVAVVAFAMDLVDRCNSREARSLMKLAEGITEKRTSMPGLDELKGLLKELGLPPELIEQAQALDLGGDAPQGVMIKLDPKAMPGVDLSALKAGLSDLGPADDEAKELEALLQEDEKEKKP